MSTDDIVITGYSRTPMGNFLGELSSIPAPRLGAASIKASVERSKIDPKEIQATYMGCVLPAGVKQAPARQAALFADLSEHCACTTVNKMCASGMQAIQLAHDAIKAGSFDIMVAGGMENMSSAPHIVQHARQGLRMGHFAMKDHMFIDGLEDAYEGKLMGSYADDTAEKHNISREKQDEFAISSVNRAQKAAQDGRFDFEIVPVTVKQKKQDVEITSDEGPRIARPDKIPQLKPAFNSNGTVTAANASSIADGAASVVLMKESEAVKRGIKPWARIRAHAVHAQAPRWFTTAPIGAMQKVLQQTGWSIDDVDLFEINEAFAVVTLAAMEELKIPHGKVNVHGGACVLGHPVGASGARIIATLISALTQYDKKRGIASLCIGGGEAAAIAIERID